jgi:aspartate oxidase
MKKSELKKYIKEQIVNALSEVTVVDKDTRPEEVKDENPVTVKTAIDKAKETNKPVTIAEKDEDDVEVEDNWYKSKDEDGDKEPSKSDLKKDAKATKGIAKAKDELAKLTQEMKSLARKYKEAEGAAKEKIVADLKEKTKLKKELEAILDK